MLGVSIPVKPATQSNPNRPPNITQAGNLLHEEEDEAFGDSGYRGVEKREELTENRAYWFMEECSSLTALMSCNLNWSLNMERLFKSYLHTYRAGPVQQTAQIVAKLSVANATNRTVLQGPS